MKKKLDRTMNARATRRRERLDAVAQHNGYATWRRLETAAAKLPAGSQIIINSAEPTF